MPKHKLPKIPDFKEFNSKVPKLTAAKGLNRDPADCFGMVIHLFPEQSIALSTVNAEQLLVCKSPLNTCNGSLILAFPSSSTLHSPYLL